MTESGAASPQGGAASLPARIVRTWPKRIPPGRGYVVDSLPRYVMADYNYRAMLEAIDDDVLIVEWDIAVGAEHLADMLDLIRTTPDQVVAAPYRIYMVRRDLGPHWVMRRFDDAGELDWCSDTDESSHLFGFGLTYLPREIWRAHLAANPRGLVSDNTFSRWHHTHVRPEVPIPWGIQPVHMHYPMPEGVHHGSA